MSGEEGLISGIKKETFQNEPQQFPFEKQEAQSMSKETNEAQTALYGPSSINHVHKQSFLILCYVDACGWHEHYVHQNIENFLLFSFIFHLARF